MNNKRIEKLKSLSSGRLAEKRKEVRARKDTGDISYLEQEISISKDLRSKANRSIV